MRIILQRVTEASVCINNRVHASISKGLVVLVGITNDDTLADIEWAVSKICHLRIFADKNGQMNISLIDTMGEALVISQFTLFASTKKGNRPSFLQAGSPSFATKMYEIFCKELSTMLAREIATGVFGADMQVSLINDGPVTISIDTKNKE